MAIKYELIKKDKYSNARCFRNSRRISRHTAIAFCLATIGAMRVDEGFLIFVFYGLAIIVAESRFEANIHSLPEIIRGATLGTATALLIFGVFS